MSVLGKHILVEFEGCNAAVLDSVAAIERHLTTAATRAQATIVSHTFHHFSPHGVTGVVVIEESHLSIHTWPEYQYAAVDIFTCGDTLTPWEAYNYLSTVLEAQSFQIKVINRGTTMQTPSSTHVAPQQNRDLSYFNPSGYAVDNGNLIGLPFGEDTATVVLLPAPWEVTVSSGSGCLNGADNIRQASLQLDLYDERIPDAWKLGIYFRPTNSYWKLQSQQLKAKAEEYIHFLEQGGDRSQNEHFQSILDEINTASAQFNDWVQQQTNDLLNAGKLVGLVGGEHSIPLGYLRALNERYTDFGILQIDAHCDLRRAYEGFTYSHASIFYNALNLDHLTRLVQVGIRDYCEEEVEIMESSDGLVQGYTDTQLQRDAFEGTPFRVTCERIITQLPQHVYISFDIDGLQPDLCPHTGTPVPGGLTFAQAMYLLHAVVESGRTIIGFDLSEVNGEHEWDGNVGARVLYKLSNLMAISQKAAH